jgi:hypothetical protein
MARPGNSGTLACRIPFNSCRAGLPRVIGFREFFRASFPVTRTAISRASRPARPQHIGGLPANHHRGKQIGNKRGLRKGPRRAGVVRSATRRRFGAPPLKSCPSRSDGRTCPAGRPPSCAASSSAGRQRRTTSVLLMKLRAAGQPPACRGESRFVTVHLPGFARF